jgi:hypothetical protein
MSAYIDNGQRPVTFSPPAVIDDAISTSAPLGVTVDSTGNGFALIGAVQGFYLFPGGGLPDLPFSYYAQPDWDLIDWTQADSMIALNFQQERMFLMRAQLLDGSIRIFSFDYTNGKTPDRVRYSAWTVGGSYPLGPIDLVKNPTVGVWELYLAPSSTTGSPMVLRQKSTKAGDPNLYHDNPAGVWIGIDFRYLMAPLPSKSLTMLQHLAARMRLRSLTATPAEVYLTVQSIDGTLVVVPNGNPFELSQTPDAAFLALADFQSEQWMYLLSNNAVADNAFSASHLETFYSLLAAQR